ncbi:glycosyltransferase [Rarobacter incanus]|uniref:glycosyltransferase n=1 Tax=Rarobacter incanus TaxID=153494 RepID=UPI0014774C18|nr:glycosyltransferase [Rarobacter incanus]
MGDFDQYVSGLSTIQVVAMSTKRSNAIGSLLISLIECHPSTLFVVHSYEFDRDLPDNVVQVPLKRWGLSYSLRIIILPLQLKMSSRWNAVGGPIRLSCDAISHAEIHWVHFSHATYLKRLRITETPRYFNAYIRRWRHRWLRRRERKLLAASDMIIVPTVRLAEELVESIPEIDPICIRVRENSSDEARRWKRVAQTRRSSRTLVGMIAGGDYVRKGVFTAIRAIAQIPEVDLCIVGGSRREARVAQRYAERCGVVSQVKIIEQVSDPQIPLQNADILLFPSHYEVASLAIYEASSSGKYIVASDAGNAEEVLRSIPNTYLYDDMDSMIEIIREIDRRTSGKLK